ncbi:hypothetical protein C9374_008807 [Naegleria lovaniensis]|uniref:non-specific serine/threonine protein kinase n=1 Tax=Naegleria lovaniensis TaxID=51637 RepID=A0AA88GE17_NAELO|nr:uncharacterized protein C9374_008807 [Naegleria lovaniensis]KAG2377722.1 hypothetical protein C9374_008807 [Naegleria lovaniensis]
MVNNEFISNQGKAYGKDIGYSLYRISYEMTIYYSMENVTTYISNQTSLRSPQLYMYPGQHIPTIEFKLWNNGTERVLFVASSPVFQLEDHSIAFISYNNSASSNTRNFIGFKSFAISLYELDRDSIRGNIYLTASEIIEVWIHILPCPPDTRLHMNGNPVGTYSCISIPYIPYAIIISVASIVSILFFSLFLIAVYGIFRIYRNIFRRLKRLESKENAEKRIETKLLEKRVVLMENGDTSNLVEHPTERTSLLINSTVERKRKSSFSSQQSSWISSIDEIEILKRLAEGASGTVYLASWNGTQVALKSWKNTMSSSDHEVANDHHEQEFEEGFEKEAALLGSIRHPNVIQFYGVVVANPTRKYIVVEYLEKGSLDKLIYNSKLGIEKLSLRQKIDILLGVARGMNYLHSHAIIHRDLKPGNILIDKNYMAKICDFGLSKTWNNFSQSAITTNVGTLFYMANEMISEDVALYNHKVDVYSFAIIMWELYFEENPYLNSQSQNLRNSWNGRENLKHIIHLKGLVQV